MTPGINNSFRRVMSSEQESNRKRELPHFIMRAAIFRFGEYSGGGHRRARRPWGDALSFLKALSGCDEVKRSADKKQELVSHIPHNLRD